MYKCTSVNNYTQFMCDFRSRGRSRILTRGVQHTLSSPLGVVTVVPPHACLPLPLTLLPMQAFLSLSPSSPCRPPSPSHPPPHAGLPLPLTLLPMQAFLSLSPSSPCRPPSPSHLLPMQASLSLSLSPSSQCRPPSPPPPRG